MIIVPLSGDKITTVEGPEFVVGSYTNFKADPAVYVDVPRGQNPIVYFQDIVEINGVKVEFNKATKVFTALGVVKRKYHLPQIKDMVVVTKPGNAEDSQDDQAQVKNLKLHSRSIGLSKGLAVIDTEDNVYELTDIQGIDRAVGSDNFDRKKFLRYYKDYLPYGSGGK